MRPLLYGKRASTLYASYELELVPVKYKLERHGSSTKACQRLDKSPSNSAVTHRQNKTGASKQFQEQGQCASGLISLLKADANVADWQKINDAFGYIIQTGMESDAFIASALIKAYMELGCLDNAFKVFDMVPNKDTATWNAMIAGCANNGYGSKGLIMFGQIQHEGMIPSKATMLAVLQSCAAIEAFEEGRKIHLLIIWFGLGSNIHVQSSLIDMYGKCNSIHDAHLVFRSMCEWDIVSWNVMVTAYADQGLHGAAYAILEQMKQQGSIPNNQTFLSMLRTCAKGLALKKGKYLHAQVHTGGFKFDLYVKNALIDMYAKCKCLKDARETFNDLPVKSIVSWNVMLMGYAQQGLNMEAIALYQLMHQSSERPDCITFTTMLKVCAALAALELGRHVHMEISETRDSKSDDSLYCALIEMYAVCQSIDDAFVVFNCAGNESGMVRNALMTAYSDQGLGTGGLSLVEKMQQDGMELNKFTFINIVKACTNAAGLDIGKAVYAHIVKTGMDSDGLIITSLVYMHTSCGGLQDAFHLFMHAPHRDVAMWTCIISGYLENCMWEEAASLFLQMQKEGVQPDKVAFVAGLKICIGLTDIEWGKQIHVDVHRCGLQVDSMLGNTIMEMYMKCGSFDRAFEVFTNMDEANTVSWNVMIAGIVQEGHDKEAFELFEYMLKFGAEPDDVTLVSALKACSMLGSLEKGKQIHAQIKRHGCEIDVILCNALLDMYTKCGSIGHARDVFDKLCVKNSVSWNILIAGYAQNGLGNEAIKAFEQMRGTGVMPDMATVGSLLSACNHEGLVVEAFLLISWYSVSDNLLPAIGQYAYMVESFSRAGCLLEAGIFIQEIPVQPNAILWMTLLGACRYRGYVAFGMSVFAFAIELESNSTAYFMMSNVYAAFGR